MYLNDFVEWNLMLGTEAMPWAFTAQLRQIGHCLAWVKIVQDLSSLYWIWRDKTYAGDLHTFGESTALPWMHRKKKEVMWTLGVIATKLVSAKAKIKREPKKNITVTNMLEILLTSHARGSCPLLGLHRYVTDQDYQDKTTAFNNLQFSKHIHSNNFWLQKWLEPCSPCYR